MDAATGRPLVTKTTFRLLHTLRTLGLNSEPNITVLWSELLPEAFKLFSARVAVDTSSTHFESDDLMSAVFVSRLLNCGPFLATSQAHLFFLLK